MSVSHSPSEQITLRAPDTVMRLSRLGSFFPSRLSFIPQLLRRLHNEKWTFKILQKDLDSDGYGTAVYSASNGQHTYSLIVFSHELPPEKRSDRVIAEAWDATFNLFDGIPTEADIQRLSQNTPKQEAGRYRSSELTLSRANKSVRLFAYVRDCLAKGQQPDAQQLTKVGYLMRTTAVYGSGKFGCADRGKIADRPEFQAAFQVEMLAVYLFRWFTIDLINHCAKAQGGAQAVELDEGLVQCLGIGNSTGLGMSPFLIKHYQLINNWITARETALARVRSLEQANDIPHFLELFAHGQQHIEEWQVDNETQQNRIDCTRQELQELVTILPQILQKHQPWNALFTYVTDNYSEESQEFIVSMMLAPHGDITDELCKDMCFNSPSNANPAMTVKELLETLETHFAWALKVDFDDPLQQQHFWYYSEDKIEPRFGSRYEEKGAEREMPLTVTRDVHNFYNILQKFPVQEPVATVLLQYPDMRNTLRRVQSIVEHPYGEIRDNLIAKGVRPLDILRLKLSFFGVMKFDPKSDLWLRVNMFQGAPLPLNLHKTCRNCPSWAYPLSSNRCCWNGCTKS